MQQLEAQLALAHVEITSLKQQIEQAAERAQRDAELARRDTAQAVELAKRDADLKDVAHRMDREHLINQIAELKALLYRPALAAPVGVPAAPTDDI